MSQERGGRQGEGREGRTGRREERSKSHEWVISSGVTQISPTGRDPDPGRRPVQVRSTGEEEEPHGQARPAGGALTPQLFWTHSLFRGLLLGGFFLP